MKLKDWAKKTGVTYLTAYKWFKSGTLPVKAHQTETGTILVQDNSNELEWKMTGSQNNDVISLVLKKTIELSKNNSPVEDLTSWVLSNFSLRPLAFKDDPTIREEIIKDNYKEMLSPKYPKPEPKMFIIDPDNCESLNSLIDKDDLSAEEFLKIGKEINVPANIKTNDNIDIIEREIIRNVPVYDKTNSVSYLKDDNHTFSRHNPLNITNDIISPSKSKRGRKPSKEKLK